MIHTLVLLVYGQLVLEGDQGIKLPEKKPRGRYAELNIAKRKMGKHVYFDIQRVAATLITTQYSSRMCINAQPLYHSNCFSWQKRFFRISMSVSKVQLKSQNHSFTLERPFLSVHRYFCADLRSKFLYTVPLHPFTPMLTKASAQFEQ